MAVFIGEFALKLDDLQRTAVFQRVRKSGMLTTNCSWTVETSHAAAAPND